MSKKSKTISLICMVFLLVSFGVSTTVFAAEKAIDIADATGYYIDITSVTDEKTVGTRTIYVTTSPTTVTFVGGGLSREDIYYLPDAKVEGANFVQGDKSEEVVFTVKKYNPSLECGDEYNELTKKPENIPYYVHGNYAVLNKPGYYMANGSMEASAGTTVIIQVTGGSASAQSTPAQSTPVQSTESAAPAVSVPAEPTNSKVMVDGKLVAFEAYNINGNNYFKLRDLAKAINGSAKNFEIGWDEAKNAINLTSAKAYTIVGGELKVSANPVTAQADSTTSKIYLDGNEVKLTAYNIGGNNYFKLRDIGRAINFNVTWDEAANTIGIDTSSDYKD